MGSRVVFMRVGRSNTIINCDKMECDDNETRLREKLFWKSCLRSTLFNDKQASARHYISGVILMCNSGNKIDAWHAYQCSNGVVLLLEHMRTYRGALL